MTDRREVRVSLPEEVAGQLDRVGDRDAYVTDALAQRIAADREQALANIQRLAGGSVDPALVNRALKVLGRDPLPEGDSGAPHAAA
ncbi:hypothetical protein HLB23_04060 [Nocardia uniformis]|uniref:Uncharacterized protein n=1 Tax=Nocardia uniformis TaxID=53432 RepID=A0A849BR17_9NOCA|nr:hypothetical protein [Nocardia uniformis]NNH69053.1 hypothetical protein [Nocardia uniformis]